MKKMVKLSLIMLAAIICFAGVVYAASSCKISLEIAKSEFSKNEEFSVDVKLSDIQSERGFIALEAVLEYDKSSLTLVKMQGQNEWSNPIKDLSYNEATGKLVIDKNGLAKSDEVILKLTFKVNENSKDTTTITLKDIKASDATSPVQVATVTKNITIKNGGSTPIIPVDPDPTPDPEPTPDPTPNPDTKPNETQKPNTNTNANTNNKDNTISTDKMPKTGTNAEIVVGSIVVIAVAGIIFGIKSRKMN